MISLVLFSRFFYLGIIALGGGLALIPFLEELVNQTGWISLNDLTNIIALAEMTPGAMGVNMATYTGFMVAGIWGGLCATLGLIAPSLLMVCIISPWLKKLKTSPICQSVFNAAKAAVIGLLFSVFITLFLLIYDTGDSKTQTFEKTILFFGLFYLAFRYRPNPVWYILGMGVLGIVLEL